MTTLSNPHRVTCMCDHCVMTRIDRHMRAELAAEAPKPEKKRGLDPRYWRKRPKP